MWWVFYGLGNSKKLGAKLILNGTIWNYCRIAYLKGQDKKSSLPLRVSRLVVGPKRTCHVHVVKNIFIKGSRTLVKKTACMIINSYRIKALVKI